jgi:AcrR family transcriptional regulator
MATIPKRERTRRQLIAAGFEVLAERGEAMTATDVVTAAAVSNGTFYNHFTDRDDFVRALAHAAVVGIAESSAAETEGEDPVWRFALATARVLQAAVANPVVGRVVLRLAELPSPPHEEVQQHLRADLDEGLSSGRFRYGADGVTLDLVTGTILATLRRISLGRGGADPVAPVVERLLLSLGLGRREAGMLARRAAARAAEATEA